MAGTPATFQDLQGRPEKGASLAPMALKGRLVTLPGGGFVVVYDRVAVGPRGARVPRTKAAVGAVGHRCLVDLFGDFKNES